MSMLHNVKIKIDERGKGEVYHQDKPLLTTGTKVVTGWASETTMPEVTIYTIAETLDQEITTDSVTIVPIETCLRIWDYRDAPEGYKALSKIKWKEAYVLRVAKKHNVTLAGLRGEILNVAIGRDVQDWCDCREYYDSADGYSITIWGWIN